MERKHFTILLVVILVAALCLGGAFLSSSLGILAANLPIRSSLFPADATYTITPTLGVTIVPTMTIMPTSLPTLAPTFTHTPGAPTSTIQPFITVTSIWTPLGTILTPVQQLTVSPTSLPIRMDGWCVPWNSPSFRAQVLRVLDGVTFEIAIDDEIYEVRYIGIDIPPSNESEDNWSPSYQKNKELVEGKSVLLIQDKSKVVEGSLMPRYVIQAGKFINLEMVSTGFAVAHSAMQDTSCDPQFREAEVQARLAKKGVWAPKPTPTRTLRPPTSTPSTLGNVVITFIQPKGEKWQEPNEFIEIRNSSLHSIRLKDWTLRDIENHVYYFPDYIIHPGQFCRIYTNEYHSGTCGFTFNHPAPIWEDDGDCAFIKDSLGNLVDEFCFE